MRRSKGTTRRPTGPAPRIRNPLSLRRSPRVIERIVSSDRKLPSVQLDRGEGKSCAIVGNAQSILDRSDGHIIDVYDKVVRINYPKTTNVQSQGSRCDILFVTPLSVKRLPRQQNHPYQIVNVGTHIVDFFNMWSDKLRQEVNCDKARPTTGFIAIAYLIDLGYTVNLFGFDWFKTPSLSAQQIIRRRDQEIETETKWQHHYPQWEEAIVKELIAKAAMRPT